MVVRIQSGWRDDGHAVLEQRFGNSSDGTTRAVADLTITQEEDLVTSLGRSASHLSLLLEPTTKAASTLEALLSSTPASHIDRDGAYNFQDGDAQMSAYFATDDADDSDDNQNSTYEVTVQVPEKINLICELDEGGSIHVEGKIEGDVKLKTTEGGDIRVTKLRGHTVDLKANSSGEKEALIYASDLLEAENLRVAMKGGRFRAKRIHGAAVDIKMTPGEQQSTTTISESVTLEGDDDEGSLVDISSMYVSGTGGAHISLEGDLKPAKRAVRIKSHHGPAVVNVSGVAKPTMDEEQSMVNSNDKKVKASSSSSYPLVDLGSVNGSCEVLIRDVPNSSNEIDNWTACHAHYDSISPESVSLLSSDCGNIELTFDRKMEADLRLLSARDNGSDSLEEISAMLADEEDPREVVATLLSTTAASTKPQESTPTSGISILTKSFTKSQACVSSDNAIEYIEGWVENKSQEPDSRFEMKTSGNKSVGKINMEGAANQALNHFSLPSENSTNASDRDSGEPAESVRPLIVAATTGKISVETLSWLGAIARRYGLDEKGRDLGRQASRRGRKIVPADE